MNWSKILENVASVKIKSITDSLFKFSLFFVFFGVLASALKADLWILIFLFSIAGVLVLLGIFFFKAYIITFDKNKKIGSEDFHNTIAKAKGIETWWHYLESTYILIVKDNISASDISKFIMDIAPENLFFVCELNLKNHNGWLPPKAWEWINQVNNNIK